MTTVAMDEFKIGDLVEVVNCDGLKYLRGARGVVEELHEPIGGMRACFVRFLKPLSADGFLNGRSTMVMWRYRLRLVVSDALIEDYCHEQRVQDR